MEPTGICPWIYLVEQRMGGVHLNFEENQEETRFCQILNCQYLMVKQ